MFCVLIRIASSRRFERVHTIYHSHHPKLSKSCSFGTVFQRTQEQVRNSRGKRAFSVRDTEVLLYVVYYCVNATALDVKKLFQHCLPAEIMPL